MLQNILIVGLGGFIGSAMRYLLNTGIYRLFDYPTFPIGILIVNVLGCLSIGFLSGLAESRELFTSELRLFIFIGFLGGFTTFSSFGYDTFGLVRDSQLGMAFLNVILHMIIGLGAVWVGFSCSRLLN